MTQNPRHLTDTELAISQQLQRLQKSAVEFWRGREKEAVISLVRVLDTSTVSHLQQVDMREKVATVGRFNHRIMSLGAAAALRPFLSKITEQPKGIPWEPLRPKFIQFSYSYLHVCGELSYLSRLSALERQGLVDTSFSSTNHVTIRTLNSPSELCLQDALKAVSSRRLLEIPDNLDEEGWRCLYTRMHSSVDSTKGWFISYRTDHDIEAAYLSKARRYGNKYHEAEALPPNTRIGDRTFGDWIHACNQALGRILCHIDYVDLLKQKQPKIKACNVLTKLVKSNEIGKIWLDAGLDPDHLSPTMQALTLNSSDLDGWESSYEPPCCPYINLSKEHILAPCFGTLTNPYFALFRHLRSVYKSDWDRGVDAREGIFRADLAKAFPEPHFLVPPHGFQLRRPDNSKITDIDAVVLDRRHGTLALVQLKWHDIYGFSLSERESRRRNITKANEWTERVMSWANGRTSSQLAKEFCLASNASDTPPLLYVVARYGARFTGVTDQDSRASWLAWPEILNVMHSNTDGDILSQIPRLVLKQQARFNLQEERHHEFRFPDLSVHLITVPDS